MSTERARGRRIHESSCDRCLRPDQPDCAQSGRHFSQLPANLLIYCIYMYFTSICNKFQEVNLISSHNSCTTATALVTSFESRPKWMLLHDKCTFMLFSASQRHPAWDICSEKRHFEKERVPTPMRLSCYST